MEKSKIFDFKNKKNYTILSTNMIPIHFELLVRMFKKYGYNIVLLENKGPSVIEEGLKYVHNDTCYPALIVIGQMIDALKSGKYDLDSTALIITQTGGGCRASNYIHLLRKALKKANLDVPVISLNFSGLEKETSLRFNLKMVRKAVALIFYSDLIMLLKNQTEIYEKNKGDVKRLVDKLIDYISSSFDKEKGISKKDMRANFKMIVSEFAKIETVKTPKIKVGIVGEIYVKYSALANNGLEEFLKEQDCEVMIPGLMGFVLYTLDVGITDHNLYGESYLKSKIFGFLLKYLLGIEAMMLDAIKEEKKFIAPKPFSELKKGVDGIIGTGCKMGEGWLLTAEMAELIEHGYSNIVCAQPFGCLPNHVCGKGVIRTLNNKFKNTNIVPVDYDAGATKVNQENRIKLMLAVAKEKLNK